MGISTNHTASQKAFAKELGLNYPLLSAFDHPQVIADYVGWLDEERRLAKRAYFVIDKEGKVRFQRVMESPGEILPMQEILAVLEGLP